MEKRKVERKKNEKQNLKKKILLVFFIVAIVFLILFGINNMIESKIAESVEKFVIAFKAGDNEQAKQYVTDETISFLTIEQIPENQELMNIFLKYLTIDIKSVSKKDDEAIVRVEFSNKNFEKIMQYYMQMVIEESINNKDESISEEELQTQIIAFLSNQFDLESNEIVTIETNVKLKKVNNVWKIIIDDEFRNGLFPGLINVVESMGPQEPR